MKPIALPQGSSVMIALLIGLTAVLPVALPRAHAADASLSITAPVTIPGATASISGSGFSSGEVVHVTFGAHSVDLTANGSGSFSTSLTIPTVPASLQFASAFGVSSGKWALGYIWISGFSPMVSPNSWYVLPGAALSFSGTGFGPNETVTATYASSTLATFTTDASGSFTGPGGSLPVVLNNTTANITFTGNSSAVSTSVTITIGQLYPSIAPSTWYTAAGSVISLTGSGFASNEAINVAAGSAHASSTADVTGSFSIPALQLPGTGGALAITATGGASGASAIANIFLTTPSPWLTFSTYWAQGGSPLTIFGNSFAANEQVGLSSGSSVIGTTTADNSGNFSFPTAVPFAPSGQITITGVGGTSGVSASSQITVAPVYVDLQLASYAGAPGAAVTFIGHGYLPNEPIQLTTDRTGSAPVATFTADASGNFGGTYTVPSDFAPGLLNLSVFGTHSFVTKNILYYVTGG